MSKIPLAPEINAAKPICKDYLYDQLQPGQHPSTEDIDNLAEQYVKDPAIKAQVDAWEAALPQRYIH